MKIKATYSSKEEIPAGFAELYEEKDGVWHLTQIEGMKTEADVARVQRALTQEKKDHKTLKDSVKALTGEDRTLEDIQADLDRIPELEAAAEGSGGEDNKEKIEKLVEARVQKAVAPIQRELDRTKTLLQESEGKNKTFEEKERTRTIHDAVRQAAQKVKVLDTAQEDVLMYAERVFEVGEDGQVTVKDNVGVTPGLKPEDWLSEMQQKRPHWWPGSSGGGAKGSGGGGGFADNPWTAENWNMTKQGEVIRTLGRERADAMAKAAGTKVGGTRPIPVKK